MVIYHDHESGRRRIGVSICVGRSFRWPACVLQEMPQIDDLGPREVLGMRLVHEVVLAANVKVVLVAGGSVHRPDLSDEFDDIHPLQIGRGRMAEYRFERAPLFAVNGRAVPRIAQVPGFCLVQFHVDFQCVDAKLSLATPSGIVDEWVASYVMCCLAGEP